MNNEEFTGIITEGIRKSVEGIYGIGINQIVKGMSEASKNFFFELKYTWCSPKAVEFYNEHADELVNTINYISDEIIKMCKKIEDAHNIMSSANNSDPVIVDTPNYHLLSLPKLLDNLNGIVGMNIKEVKNKTTIYEGLMKIAISKLEDLPYRIDFFDPGRNLALTYRHMIDDMKEKITTQIDEILKIIVNAEETETDQVILSKEYAQSVLPNQ